jgi:hypothetical protein
LSRTAVRLAEKVELVFAGEKEFLEVDPGFAGKGGNQVMLIA